jgi:hypothetical protein
MKVNFNKKVYPAALHFHCQMDLAKFQSNLLIDSAKISLTSLRKVFLGIGEGGCGGTGYKQLQGLQLHSKIDKVLNCH